MRIAWPCQNCIACFYRKTGPIHLHITSPTYYVIDLILFLQVIPDCRSRVQYSFPENNFAISGGCKKVMSNGFSTSIMWPWLLFSNVFFMMKNITWLLLVPCKRSRKDQCT